MAKRKRNTRNDERPESRKQEILNLEDQARVNFELANELLSVLREQEGQIFDIADGHRYINYETGFMAYSELRTYGRSICSSLSRRTKPHFGFSFRTMATLTLSWSDPLMLSHL